MPDYDQLKGKWLKKVREGAATDGIDYEHILPGSFCVRFRVGGSAYGPFGLEMTWTFDNAADALAYYRFYEIPAQLHAAIKGSQGIESPDPAEVYIERLLDSMKDKFTGLLDEIDDCLGQDVMTGADLERIRESINAAMSALGNEYEIDVWGGLETVLTCDDLQERLAMEAEYEEEVEAESDVEDDMAFGDSGDVLRLKQLLDDGTFDENNQDHVDLAISFLGKCESY